MALFYLQISTLPRSAGRRATAAAAYRAGERIRDERSGIVHNYTRRRDVLHTEIFVPQSLENAGVAWARNRERLWNAAEQVEKRRNARVAREFLVTLPPELNPTQRVAAARVFARELAERYHVAVDLAVHEPRSGSDPRNFHAHLLTTTREVTPAGLGAKAGLDLAPLERRRRELPDHREEYIKVRERWATVLNEALREAQVEARVDHRSLAAQGIDREPQPRIPWGHLKMEQRGMPSHLAERLRADYRARVEQRQRRAAAAEIPPDTLRVDPAPATVRDVEAIRREAREAWLRIRPREAQAPAAVAEGPRRDREAQPTPAAQSGKQADDDLAL